MFHSKLNIDVWENFSREVLAVIDKKTGTQTATPPAPIPSDPHSDAYARYQMKLYNAISGGRKYAPETTELVNILSTEDIINDPWPFQSKDAGLIGCYLLSVGLIIRVLSNGPHVDVLEYGIGAGHTTLAMARSGMNVTAVDIEPKFLEAARANAANHGVKITTHVGEFGSVPDDDAKFDAVVFYECFHHCFDHHALIKTLARKLKPNGRILLCNENITDSFPYPWGLRLDTHSMTMTRWHGWMELGFQETYLIDLFKREGFSVSKHIVDQAGDAGVLHEFTLS